VANDASLPPFGKGGPRGISRGARRPQRRGWRRPARFMPRGRPAADGQLPRSSMPYVRGARATGGEKSHARRPVIPTNAEGSLGTEWISRSARNDPCRRIQQHAWDLLHSFRWARGRLATIVKLFFDVWHQIGRKIDLSPFRSLHSFRWARGRLATIGKKNRSVPISPVPISPVKLFFDVWHQIGRKIDLSPFRSSSTSGTRSEEK
jgi:hypothetical protein